jgi:stress-induced-phosphoprotein 1
MDKIKPKYEKMEKDRKSALSGPERIKEQGDSLFKNANFEGAIEQYTKAIDSIKDKGSDIALKCYGNRAACWKQLSNFDETIGDCSHVLEYRENDVKALIRRAQAFEACERYKFALQDARQVISLGMETTGKATFDLANGMQHRLNKVIQQLKQG